MKPEIACTNCGELLPRDAGEAATLCLWCCIEKRDSDHRTITPRRKAAPSPVAVPSSAAAPALAAPAVRAPAPSPEEIEAAEMQAHLAAMRKLDEQHCAEVEAMTKRNRGAW